MPTNLCGPSLTNETKDRLIMRLNPKPQSQHKTYASVTHALKHHYSVFTHRSKNFFICIFKVLTKCETPCLRFGTPLAFTMIHNAFKFRYGATRELLLMMP